MLTRAQQAARQRSRIRLTRHASLALRELELPWLAPAASRGLGRHRRSLSSTRSPSPSPSPARPSPLRQHTTPDLNPHHRKLATTADPAHFGNTEEHIPFDGASLRGRINDGGPRSGHAASDTQLWQRPASDFLHVSPYAIQEPYKTHSNWKYGIPADINERQIHLYASLRVGRLDRAAKLVRDMADHCFVSHAPELINAHEQYLLASLEQLLREPTRDRLLDMQKWFELDIQAKSVPLTADMLSCILKAALVTLRGTKLHRTLRRYIQQASAISQEMEQDVLASSLLTETEVGLIVGQLSQRYESYSVNESEAAKDDFDSMYQLYGGDSPLELSPAYADSQAPGVEKVPELLESEQKGLGLSSLKSSLSALHEISVEDPDSEIARIKALQAQERIEADVLEAALEKWRSESEITQEMRARGSLQSASLGSHVHNWVTAMSERVRQELARVDAVGEGQADASMFDLVAMSSLIRLITPEKLAASTVVAFMTAMFSQQTSRTNGRDSIEDKPNDVPTARVCQQVGRDLLADIRMEQLDSTWKHRLKNLGLGDRKRALSQLFKQRAEAAAATASPSDGSTSLQNKVDSSSEAATHETDMLLKLSAPSIFKLGALVFRWFTDVAKLPVPGEDPSITEFVAVNEVLWRKGKKVNVVSLSRSFLDRLKKEPADSTIAKHLPMVVQPRPWRRLDDGAYLRAQSSAVRGKDSSPTQYEYIKAADKRGDMAQVYKGLDVIGKVPWRINGPLFEVMTEIWNTGEELANFAPENPNENYPPEPSKEDKVAYGRWKGIVQALRNEATGLHSQRCYQNLQLEVARSFLNKTFYCPHSIDFRGRAYPIPPYLNHMSADNIRGLFMFARGKPLGEAGLRWLKIHLANMFGYDKESLRDREKFTMDNLKEVYDSAEKPLTGNRWWLQSEDCWQTLAACMELRNALESSNPAEFVSHLPVQQDGSCNGLQHYAALGGDEIGARQVNLAPGDKPADVYSAVADLVKKYVAEDAKLGIKEARIMDGKIVRKVVKQPVMTNVYGVTFVGASRQVRKQLADILPKATLDNDIDLLPISQYLAKLIFRALGEMFNGAYAIQRWLGECGSRISSIVTPEQIERIIDEKNGIAPRAVDSKYQTRVHELNARKPDDDYQFKSTIVWTTPLGLPVVQPYREYQVKMVRTNMAQLNLTIARASDPVNKRKQLQAFPPNFIHSLDATHMMLSALKCDEVGLQFSSVHDSFWTHAADVPVMNRILRDAFIQMHSEDIVGRLREEFIERYKGCMEWTSVKRNSPLGRKLIKWYKFRGLGQRIWSRAKITNQDQIDLMLEEVQRLKMLSSEDVEDQVKGRDMETPASFAADMAEDASSAVEVVPDGPEDNVVVDVEVDGMDAFAADALVNTGEPISASAPPPPPSPSPTKKAPQELNVHFWRQVVFPETPQKGSFDVRQLKESQYFFS